MAILEGDEDPSDWLTILQLPESGILDQALEEAHQRFLDEPETLGQRWQLEEASLFLWPLFSSELRVVQCLKYLCRPVDRKHRNPPPCHFLIQWLQQDAAELTALLVSEFQAHAARH